MGKGSKPRPVSKNYGAEYDRIFGSRCIKHRRANCQECFPESTKPPEPDCTCGPGGGPYCCNDA